MIKQAIIPLAGLGTRLLPLTSVFAKELLPINGRPGIEYILDECIEAGIKEIIFIISAKKIMIKNYFYSDQFYKNIIKKKKDPRIINEYKKILKYKNKIKFVFQNIPKGTGDAVLKTQKYIKNKYFLMLLPDDLIIKKNCSMSMIKVHKKYQASVMASMKVKKNNVSRWGIYKINKKLMIKKYFYSDHFYKNIIKKKKDPRIINEYKKIIKYKNKIKFVFQNVPKGTGDAVLKTQKFIKNKYFLMLLPDDLIIKKNCSMSMIKVHKKYQASVMASMKVKKNNVSRWGIYKINKKLNKRDYLIDGVVEKPSIKNAPSNNAVIGRYILPRTIFKKIKSLKPGKGKEIHITDAIQLLINDKEKFVAHNFEGKYLDCGTMSGYINSSKEIGKI